MEIKEMARKKQIKGDPVVYEERLKKMRKEHEKMCKGMFEFIDAQGGWLEFTYRVFPGEPVTYLRIDHGEIVDLPIGIVRHLNNTKKKVRRYDMVELKGNRGVPQSHETISRLRFTPMDVM